MPAGSAWFAVFYPVSGTLERASGYALQLFLRWTEKMPLEWIDANDVVTRVGETFSKRVLENSGRGSSVRFGLTGSGEFPNYQVEVDGKPRSLFRGASHKAWTGDESAFVDGRISQPIGYQDLYEAFVLHFRQAKGTPPKR